jgi:hypothetical protein
MEPEDLLPCSQKPTTGSYPQSVRTSPCSHTLLCKINLPKMYFVISNIPASLQWCHQLFNLLALSTTNMLYSFPSTFFAILISSFVHSFTADTNLPLTELINDTGTTLHMRHKIFHFIFCEITTPHQKTFHTKVYILPRYIKTYYVMGCFLRNFKI